MVYLQLIGRYLEVLKKHSTSVQVQKKNLMSSRGFQLKGRSC